MTKPQTDEELDKILQPAFALVGNFIFLWSALENTIAASISSLLKLKEPTASIVLANVTFRDKLFMLSTFCAVTYDNPNLPEAKKAAKLFRRIGDFNTNYRNLLVHHPFIPGKSSIRIYRTIAKGRLERPKTVWNKTFFEDRFAEIDKMEEEIDALVADVKRRDGIKLIASLLSQPSLGTPPLGFADRQHLPLGGILGLSQMPTPGIGPQSGPKPQGKSED